MGQYLRPDGLPVSSNHPWVHGGPYYLLQSLKIPPPFGIFEATDVFVGYKNSGVSLEGSD